MLWEEYLIKEIRNLKRNVRFAQVDNYKELIVLVFHDGEVQVNKLKTGELIYNHIQFEPLIFDIQINCLMFVDSKRTK